MHFCDQELNAIINSLPLVEHFARYARSAWCWLCAKVRT